MATTIDSTAVNDGLTGTALVRQVKTQFDAAAADVGALITRAQCVTRPADAAANTATAETTIFEAQAAMTISAIKLCADAAVVANDTDYLTITIKKRDGAGGAATTVASATSAVTGGIAIAQFTKVSLGALTGATLAAGTILTLTVAKAGAGKALPTHSVFLEFS